jgi:uncharacterized protein YheU (UPF0270 family)
MHQHETERGIIIPHDRLSPEALQGLVEEFVTRNGTDGGYTGKTLEQNVAMVIRQLNRGEAVVVFDEVTQSANIVSKNPNRQSM